MKQIIKLIIIFLLTWFGIKSLISAVTISQSSLGFIIDIFLFIVLVGSPAASYWGHIIDEAFNSNENNENEE